MKKSIKYLLEKGYFPEELPPSFTTKYFSNNFELIEKDWNKIDPKIDPLPIVKTKNGGTFGA